MSYWCNRPYTSTQLYIFDQIPTNSKPTQKCMPPHHVCIIRSICSIYITSPRIRQWTTCPIMMSLDVLSNTFLQKNMRPPPNQTYQIVKYNIVNALALLPSQTSSKYQVTSCLTISTLRRDLSPPGPRRYNTHILVRCSKWVQETSSQRGRRRKTPRIESASQHHNIFRIVFRSEELNAK